MRLSARFLLAGAAALLVVTGACRERNDLDGDTVRVRLPDRTTELDVISCGLDGDVFVLGASSADAFVQLLLVVDGDEIDRDRSAITVEVARDGVLGAGSPDALGVRPGVTGEITSATIRGDRVDVEADARLVDDASGEDTVPLEVAGRCPAVDDFV